MKRSFIIIFALLSIFFGYERGQADVCNYTTEHQLTIEDEAQSFFSQGDNSIDQCGLLGTSAKISTSNTTKTAPSRRNTLDSYAGVRVAIASLYSESSYTYSCNFPFDHQPQRELFFILRNIRI